MAHYYVEKCAINARMSQVSLGGSTLRIQLIKNYCANPQVTDVCVDMQILTSLFPSNSGALKVQHRAHSVYLKYDMDLSLGSGPSMIFGCNGGMQWMGSPHHIRESLSAIMRVANNSLRGKAFLEAISRSREMVRYIYPGGIPRITSNGTTIAVPPRQLT